MSPSSEEPKKRGPIVRLTGTCGHAIDVRLSASDTDVAATGAARSTGAREALLERFCPYCVATSRFKLPLETANATQPRRNHEPTLRAELRGQTTLLGEVEVVPPIELAYRNWERSRAESDPKRAEQALRLAADIFDRAGRFVEVQQIQDEIARRFP